MKTYLLLLSVAVSLTLASRDDWGSSGSRGSGSSGTRGSGSSTGDRWGSGSGGSGSSGSRFGTNLKCQWVRGHVKCADSNGKHDKNTVVVRLADSRKTYDEGYTSQNGQFQVFGCDSSSLFRPELQVLHFCKSNRARKLKLAVPVNADTEWNITQVIDLKAYNPDEADYMDNIQLPCVP